MKRRELAQVVDDARSDSDDNASRTVEHLIDALDVGPVGMELLLFDEEALAGNARLSHKSLDSFAGSPPRIVIGDDYSLPIRKMLPKKGRSTMKNVLAEFECFRIGCDS